MTSAEKLAKRFHELYEELAPFYNYVTRKESAKPWDQVPLDNRTLMIAVCSRILEEVTLSKQADYGLLSWLEDKVKGFEPCGGHPMNNFVFMRGEINGLTERLERLEADRRNSAQDETNPFHDQGNATNHRLSQCTPVCSTKEIQMEDLPKKPAPPGTFSRFLDSSRYNM